MKALVVVAAALLFSAAFAGVEYTSAKLYYSQGEWEKALKFYDQALEKEPGNLEAYWERGRLLGEIALDSTRAGLAQTLTNNSPTPATELFARMAADFKRAQTTQSPEDEKALKKFKKKLEQFQQERWNDFYFAAVEIDTTVEGSTPDEMGEAGRARMGEALGKLDLAIMLIPARWNSYGQKAQIYERLGNIANADSAWRAAQTVLEATGKSEADREQVLTVIRQHLLANGYELDHFEETVKLADEIIAKDAANLDAVQYKAFSLARLAGDTSRTEAERTKFKADAIKALDAARAARADDPIVVYYMGQFNLELGDTAAAINSFTDYLTLEKDDQDVLFALGVIYLEGGSFANNARALEIFESLTVTHEDFQAGWQNYGVALVRSGKTAEAKKALERAKALEGK